MNLRPFSASLLATAILAALPAATSWSATRSEAESAIAAAEEARQKAAAVGGEWRDTAKRIASATKLLDTREYTRAIGLVGTAQRQGELGYEQAMSQKDAGLPGYMIALVNASQPAVANREKPAADIAPVEVLHNGVTVVIQRHHDKEATLPEEFLKTDRTCPPFCVQPMSAGAGVETVGEREVVAYLGRAAAGEPVLVVDSRTPEWVLRGTIPGSINVPWDRVAPQQQGTFGDQNDLQTLLTESFGVTQTESGELDFSTAKTLVLFCNGIWCGQSSANIATLLQAGYPPEKLKWYRGGVQDWASVGLTLIK